MEEELGMINFDLGDEFYEEDSNPNQNEDDNIVVNTNEIIEELDEGNNLDEVVEDDTEDDEDIDENNDDTSSPPLYKSLASYLQTEGVLTSVDSSKLEKVETIEALAELINEEADARVLRNFTPLQQEAIEAFKNGVDVETFKQQKIVENNLDSITEDIINSDQELRSQLIYQDFINQGFSEQKAQRLTDRSVQADDDIEDAKEALENIKKGVKDRYVEEQTYKSTQKQKEQDDYVASQKLIEKNILETEEPLKGIKLNETARKQILTTMMNPVGKNPVTGVDENQLMKDQRENKDFSQKLYTVYTLSKGFTDFSYFGKKEKANEIKNIEKALKNNQHVLQGGDASFLDDPNASDFEIGNKILY
jgi:hypothetical protein